MKPPLPIDGSGAVAERKRGIMKRHMILRVLLVVVLVAAAVACEKEGPAEQAGKKIDEAVEEAGDKLGEAGEAVQEKAEEMKEKAEKATQ